MSALLVVFAGLPGVGRGALARRVGGRLRAAVLPVDPVRRKLTGHGLDADRALSAAYDCVTALAEVQLGLDLPVVVDAVNAVAAVRRPWEELADRVGAPIRVVEVSCGDVDEHRRRIERGIAAGADGAPTWEQVLVQRAGYEPYVGPRLVVDTSVGGDPLAGILDYLA